MFGKSCLCSPIRIFIASILYLFQFIKSSLRSPKIIFDILATGFFLSVFLALPIESVPIYSIRMFRWVVVTPIFLIVAVDPEPRVF